jgi:hypothetical protein
MPEFAKCVYDSSLDVRTLVQVVGGQLASTLIFCGFLVIKLFSGKVGFDSIGCLLISSPLYSQNHVASSKGRLGNVCVFTSYDC